MAVTIILCLILALIGFFAVRGSVKHMKGEGSCCGGGNASVKIEKAPPSKETELNSITLKINGMKCENCAVKVSNALNSMDEVWAKVDLRKNRAKIQFTSKSTPELLCEAVEKAGYSAEIISR